MSDAPLNVLVITSQLPPDIGGTSVHAAEISKGLAALGHRVTVVIRDRDPAEFAELGLDVISIDTKTGLLKPLRQRRAQRDVMDLIREREVQVVFFAYTVVGFGDLYGRLASAGIPYAVGIHGFNKSDLESDAAIQKKRKKWGLTHAAKVITCTRWLGKTIQPLVGRPVVETVHYGIDRTIDDWATPERVAEVRARYALDGKRVLLCLGRYVPRKNFDSVFRVVPRLLERFHDLYVLMVGGGQEEQTLKDLAQELGIAERVIWGPQVAPHEVGVFYKAADLFVTVSYTRPEDDTYETFGLVYAEANLCGTAVVGGKEGGVPEAVLDGETGLLVHAGDLDAMHDALAELLADDARREAMAQAGRARVLDYVTWERAARETAEVLRAAAQSR
ncbi:MAG: glycosyltransferase family 4 protein [Planctomycetota bacterium]